MAMLLGGGQTAGTVRILQSETIDLGFDDVLSNQTGQGVMWYREYNYGERNACHGGSDFGVSTELCLMLESGIGTAVLVNKNSEQSSVAIQKVRDLLFDQGQQLLGNIPTPPPPVPLPHPSSGGGGQISVIFLLLLYFLPLVGVRSDRVMVQRKSS
jgi:hypothetical protein